MQSWEEAFKAGTLNEVQAKFCGPKPAEELYDVEKDPHNVNNLASDIRYKKILENMREATRKWQLQIKDVGLIPEPMMIEISKRTDLYSYARSNVYPLEKIIEIAEMASSGNLRFLSGIIQRLNDGNPIVRYWAAIGCTILQKQAAPAKDALKALLDDPEICVRIAAAEAVYHLGERKAAVESLEQALRNDNLMARVQALNVLETIDEDASPVLGSVKALIPDTPANQYDVRSARRLVEKLESRN
jgi:N-sulfoglucosamine sulfohydrolase